MLGLPFLVRGPSLDQQLRGAWLGRCCQRPQSIKGAQYMRPPPRPTSVPLLCRAGPLPLPGLMTDPGKET